MHTYIHTYIHTYTHTHIHTYTHIHTHTWALETGATAATACDLAGTGEHTRHPQKTDLIN